ncbi:hypothetical protein DN53_11555 [Flagellimonas olearia]|uniref:DUF6973 domain-containing protein n=2 Tax=Flagellimonas olearia TaxID=552546 RepID=A0A444VNX6_9FLAO|nr:hypothetical protein DN53_11555 [Allomuricauda olearia]
MNPIAVLKRVDFKNILKVIFIGMSHPFFIVPTIRATKDCIRISADNYGRLHHENGPANAFRHALWNYLIAKRCFRIRHDKDSVLQWAEKITDWHEHVFPNTELAKTMDFHNNAVGRLVFRENPEKTESEIIELLKSMTLVSVKIDSNTKLASLKTQFIHILDQ